MKNWKTINSDIVFSAPPYLDVVKQTVELPNGNHIDDFYQVHLRPFVIVVPVLTNGNILTIRQYKHGLGRVSLTFPAGFVEDGEDPIDACRRELLEETGYQANALIHMGEFVDNGNQRGCLGNYYVARNCHRVTDAESGDLEEMKIQELSVGHVDKALKDGNIAILHNASAWALANFHDLIVE